ncbi:MAG TPA: hypothetical protein VK517_01140, partial [Cyclobacteriaceae bacterium]|nr:hypothetical protein [Cyclobacteriaceae bacterium]
MLRSFLFATCLLFFSKLSFAQDRVKEYYTSGKLRGTGQIVNDQKEGEWISYYPSGKKNAIENYKAGKLHGQVTYYYPAEVVQGIETWREGTLQDSAWYFHPNGKLHRVGFYKDSQYSGKWR